MKKYWLYIESYTCIFLNQNEVLFYNTLNGVHIHSKNEEIIKIAKRLKKSENLQVIGIDESTLSHLAISKFIKKLRDSFSGDILEQRWSDCKPVQFPPVLKIRREAGYTKESWYGDHILTNLNELTFYINDYCNQKCENCQLYNEQFSFCRKSDSENLISLKSIESLLAETTSSSLSCVNISGGNIFRYKYISELFQVLDKYNFKKNFFINYLNITPADKELLELMSACNGNLKLLVNFPINILQLSQAFKVLWVDEIETIFIVQDEKEINSAEEIIIKNNLKNCQITPFYSGKNITFFEKNVFVSLNDIKESSPKQEEIFTRRALNPLEFGKINNLSNGDFHTNMNTAKLGNIYKNNIYDILFKEFTKGQSWRKRRQNLTPCRTCVYNLLCPPLSSYERVIGKPNLCVINP